MKKGIVEISLLLLDLIEVKLWGSGKEEEGKTFHRLPESEAVMLSKSQVI